MIFNEMNERTWRSFYLSNNFLAEFKDKKPSWSDYSKLVFKRTYARPKEDGKLEDWWECCKRVVEGTYTLQKAHCKRNGLRWDDRKSQTSAQEMYRRMFSFKFLPPGRGLWTMGTSVVLDKGSACLNNCGFVSTVDIDVDFASPFTFLMDMSMLGVGIGADTKGAGKVTIQDPTRTDNIFLVEDSREGWIDALRTLLNCFVGKNALPIWDVSLLREKGAPIKGFGGVSSGPAPLLDMLSEIEQLLLKQVGNKITSTDIVDIFNIIGVCVVSGGVRRTAEIMFGEQDDNDFIDLKDYEKNPHRVNYGWASNNSIYGSSNMDYSDLVPRIAANGEPGIIWLDNMRKYSRMNGEVDWKDERAAGCNPCAEQTLESFELCCLVETFPSNHGSYEDYQKTLKFAYLYAKTVTLVRTHDPRVNAVMLRNRRIGCSMSGIIQAFDKFGRRNFLDNWCNSGYEYIQKCDKHYSEWLCVPRSIKTTSVKPSGTVSLLAGTTPGIHYAHSEYYIRNIRLQDTSPLVQACIDAGYQVEPCVVSKNTYVASFLIKEENFSKGKTDASIWLQVANAVEMQEKWADNQVSITVTFNKEEAKEIKEILEVFGPKLKSISFLPLTEHGYEQAPYIEITEKQYQEMSLGISEIDFDRSAHEAEDKFCDGAACEI